jgi:DNA/RNA endonuclease YhcR with UshA esterase domain
VDREKLFRKKSITLIAGYVVIGVLAAAGGARAHHADSLYDQDRLVTVTGVVTRFEFVNPHDLIYLDVRDDQGKLRQWLVYGAAPVTLAKAGWNQKTIQPGEQLTITGFQRKDGRRGMLHLKIARANGEALRMGEAEENYLRAFEARKANFSRGRGEQQ